MTIEVYRRREPEETLLYKVVQENLPAFLELTDSRGRGLPKYVRNGFEKFLECGILRNGFARVRCPGGHRRRRALPCSRELPQPETPR